MVLRGEGLLKIQKSFVILLILALAILAGCGNEQYPKDVVAVVNGKTISEKDIEKKLTERKMTSAFANSIGYVEPIGITPKEALIKGLNVNGDDLTPDQLRYLESTERLTTKLLSNNEAFNILLREAVLYQQALKEGYSVSTDDAKQILAESKQATDEKLKNDKDAQEKYNETLETNKKIYNQFGFQSEEDYLNQRIDKTAQALTISRMKNQFNKVITDKLPKANGLQLVVEKQNAWDDYSEYLLKKAKVEILNKEYSIEIYGGPWSYGTLDLKSK